MKNSFVMKVYETMIGMRNDGDTVSNIENAFEPNSYCDKLYEEVYQANKRLCNRLGVGEDVDVERIINNMLAIQKDLCIRMFYAGVQFGDNV